MKGLKELQIKEALDRLNILQKQYELIETVTNEFRDEGTIYYSEYINKVQQGILYWVDNREDFVNSIKEFEEGHSAIVYHVILTPTEFGDMLSLLYVSMHQEEWKRDREELEEGYPFAYCINGDISEFGAIQITGANGGISRLN